MKNLENYSPEPSERYLIVNADDFGYSYSVNRGIIEAHTEGVVTSTSVMVDAIAAHEASELAKYPELSVGLHFDLKKVENVQAELNRQVEKFVSIVGAKPTHIDTHKRSPAEDGVREVLLEYSQQNGTPIRKLGFAKFIESFIGFRTDGDVSVPRLREAIDQATDEYNEIMCHVGYSDDYLREHSSYNDIRERELASVCDPTIKQYIGEKGLKLVNWKSVSI